MMVRKTQIVWRVARNIQDMASNAKGCEEMS